MRSNSRNFFCQGIIDYFDLISGLLKLRIAIRDANASKTKRKVKRLNELLKTVQVAALLSEEILFDQVDYLKQLTKQLKQLI